MKNEDEDFCSICGHLIPDKSCLGGSIEGTLINYDRREFADILLSICTECINKLDEIERGGTKGARKRAE
jgi:hypothetical protein